MQGEGRERRLRLSPEIQGVLVKALSEYCLRRVQEFERRHSKELAAYDAVDLDSKGYWPVMKAVTGAEEEEMGETRVAFRILRRLERMGTGRPWYQYYGFHERVTRKRLKAELQKNLVPGKRTH